MTDETVVHVTESPHSVEISRNASGGVAFVVKAYGPTPEMAADKAKQLFGKLDVEFPPVRK